MRKFFFISDTHYGLSAAGYDRTDETDEVMWEVVERAVSENGFLIHCGDLGHRNHPKPEVYARWVKIWERLHKAGVPSRFLVGNHDIIHDSEQLYGSLSPLQELKYPDVKAVECLQVETIRPGWFFLYLPYLSKSHLGLSPQEYAEDFLRRSLDLIEEKEGKAIVIAHWNVDGANVGGDRVMRPSQLVFPEWVCDHSAVALVVSGHIHLHQLLENRQAPHLCVGSPIYTDFGDSGEKVYVTLQVDDQGVYLDKHETSAIELTELSYDMVGYSTSMLKFAREQVEGRIVKVSVRCTEAQKESLDFEAFRLSIAEHARFVLPIRPVIVREEAHQPVVLKSGQTDEEMVEAWIRERKPPNADMVHECAKEALEKA